MPEINENMRTPNIDQIGKDSRDIFYKEHEFDERLKTIIAALNGILDESEDSESNIKRKKDQIAALLTLHRSGMDDVTEETTEKIALALAKLIEVDSAYDRVYHKIFSTIKLINANIENRMTTYDIPSSYYNEMKNTVFDTFAKKSPYKEGLTKGEEDKWTIKSPSSIVLLRDVDTRDRMITFPIIINPNIEQSTYIKLASFNPLNRLTDNSPVFLAELIISGSLYCFKGYLESANIDRSGKRGAFFNAEYGVSFDIPFSFKAVYDDESNTLALLFKYDETQTKFTSIIRLDCSIHLLVGRNLVIEEVNTEFTEGLAV
jgi:hypothetical protein